MCQLSELEDNNDDGDFFECPVTIMTKTLVLTALANSASILITDRRVIARIYG